MGLLCVLRGSVVGLCGVGCPGLSLVACVACRVLGAAPCPVLSRGRAVLCWLAVPWCGLHGWGPCLVPSQGPVCPSCGAQARGRHWGEQAQRREPGSQQGPSSPGPRRPPTTKGGGDPSSPDPVKGGPSQAGGGHQARNRGGLGLYVPLTLTLATYEPRLAPRLGLGIGIHVDVYMCTIPVYR